VKEADLYGELRILKDFFLMGRGELYLTFIDKAQDVLRAPPTITTQHGTSLDQCRIVISTNDTVVPGPPPKVPHQNKKITYDCRIKNLSVTEGAEPATKIEIRKSGAAGYNQSVR
jgi:hypothetical protein